MGSSDFEPTLAGDCAALGMNLIDKYDDPDVRKCCYSLMAAVASIMKEGMGDILNKLVPVVILSVSSNEGISFEFKEVSFSCQYWYRFGNYANVQCYDQNAGLGCSCQDNYCISRHFLDKLYFTCSRRLLVESGEVQYLLIQAKDKSGMRKLKNPFQLLPLAEAAK